VAVFVVKEGGLIMKANLYGAVLAVWFLAVVFALFWVINRRDRAEAEGKLGDPWGIAEASADAGRAADRLAAVLAEFNAAVDRAIIVHPDCPAWYVDVRGGFTITPDEARAIFGQLRRELGRDPNWGEIRGRFINHQVEVVLRNNSSGKEGVSRKGAEARREGPRVHTENDE